MVPEVAGGGWRESAVDARQIRRRAHCSSRAGAVARVSALMHSGCRIDQVYLCRDPVDFRKSIDGLSALVEQELKLDPFGSTLYVFVNWYRTKIKVLYWHCNGFCL